MGALVIAMKPAKGAPGSATMSGPDDAPEEEKQEAADDGSEFDAALDDFFKANREGDESTAKEALSAAIAAKVSALLEEKG